MSMSSIEIPVPNPDSTALGALVSVVPERQRELLPALQARKLNYVAFSHLLHGYI